MDVVVYVYVYVHVYIYRVVQLGAPPTILCILHIKMSLRGLNNRGTIFKKEKQTGKIRNRGNRGNKRNKRKKRNKRNKRTNMKNRGKYKKARQFQASAPFSDNHAKRMAVMTWTSQTGRTTRET